MQCLLYIALQAKSILIQTSIIFYKDLTYRSMTQVAHNCRGTGKQTWWTSSRWRLSSQFEQHLRLRQPAPVSLFLLENSLGPGLLSRGRAGGRVWALYSILPASTSSPPASPSSPTSNPTFCRKLGSCRWRVRRRWWIQTSVQGPLTMRVK